MESIYVDMSARREREMMMLKANVDPKFIRHRTQAKNWVVSVKKS